MRLGNGKWENTQFNSRLQPIQIGLGSSATSQNLLKLNFDYGSTDNNGNVKSQQIVVPTVGTTAGFTATQTYTYDSLNRIKDAKEMIGTNQQWKQTFTFDRYGNRRFDTANTTTLPTNCVTAVCNPTIDPATNKLVGYGFDSSGNTKVDANGQTFTYDAENKQVEVRTASNAIVGQYAYDGDGKRVKKVVPATQETTIFVYDASGKMVAEYSTAIASQQDAKVSYLTSDHLGSPRINTDANGQVIARHDYQPFGEEIQRTSYGADSTRQKFTSYERDNESKLDFAQARYYGYSYGRFTSPDRPLLDQSSSDPQSWNLYLYAGNSPTKYTDPLGLWKKVQCEGEGGRTCWEAEEGDTYESLAEETGLSPKNLGEFFQNQEIVEGRVFDTSGYNDWLKEGDWLKKVFNDGGWQMGNAAPPMGGMEDVSKVAKSSGLFGWIGKQAGRVGRWSGLIKPKQAATVAELAAKQLVGSSAREMLKDAINIVKSFKGTPQQKAELFQAFADQIKARVPELAIPEFWAAARQISTDGSFIWTGDAIGKALVISPQGEIFMGNITTNADGFIFGKGGVMTPVYEKLTKIH
jgi:RHS repeat-associated protein